VVINLPKTGIHQSNKLSKSFTHKMAAKTMSKTTSPLHYVHCYPLSSSVGARLDEVLDGRDDHRQTEPADEDVEDAGDVA